MTLDLYQKAVLIAVALAAVSIHLVLGQRTRSVSVCSDPGVLCFLQREPDERGLILALPGFGPATVQGDRARVPVRH